MGIKEKGVKGVIDLVRTSQTRPLDFSFLVLPTTTNTAIGTYLCDTYLCGENARQC